MFRFTRCGRKGFTLVEMLIVIVVIAILALIVIPRLLGAPRRATEASLKGDLNQLRNAIVQFEADCGDYPNDLKQLMEKPVEGTVGADGPNGQKLDVKNWQGPYMRTPDGQVPQDPFWDGMTTPEKIVHGQDVGGWDYRPKTGEIHSTSTLTALDGTHYNTW